MFSIVVMRPNNIQAVSKLAEFLVNLDLNYLKVVNHNICYLVLNKYLAIEYKVENEDGELIAVTDKEYRVYAVCIWVMCVFPTVVTRPDNAQAVSKLVEFLVNPGLNHLKAVDHNIHYLVSNKYLIIEYKVENKDGELITVTDKIFTAAADASYGNNPDRRLSEEHIFKLFGGVINWSLRK